ncbi:hypothetical protein DL93DRAFT_1885143 [Clavulina sp. PMI_390]|nr:hypothetical protein DL93DRAFT_1885143 [Clavulina sp. PMI_390]
MDGSDVAYDDDEVSQSLSSFGEAVASDLQPILRVLPTYGVNNGLVARGGPSGILITLLHLLPRLRILAVNAGNELEHIAKSCFGCFAGGVPAGLKSLSTLSLWWYRMGGGFRVSAVVPFLALQSLEDLTIGTLGEQLKETNGSTLAQLDLGITISPDLDLAAQQPLGGRVGKPTFIKTSAGHALLRKSSPVTRLSILSSMAPGYIVNQILSLPSNLEKFHYEVADNRNDYDPLSRADILPGLKNQAPSLKEFTLHAEPFDWLEIADRGPFLKTLPEFVALEKLSISARLLLISASYRGSGDIDAARHRLDGLLPTDLISLELDLNDIDLPMFLAQTRIPQSLVYTLQSIPSLKNLTLKGRESFDTELSVEVAHQIQSLQLQLKGSICGVDYGE